MKGKEEGDEDTVINIAISFDNTWSKRRNTANHGIGFVISDASGKVLE